MRRSAFLLLTGFALVCFSGCHHWHKHHARAAYADIEPCGCDGVYTGSLDASPIPLSHVISSSPGLVPAAPAGSTPAAAGAAAAAPAGTKIPNTARP